MLCIIYDFKELKSRLQQFPSIAVDNFKDIIVDILAENLAFHQAHS